MGGFDQLRPGLHHLIEERVHFCLGAALARLEVGILIEEVLQRKLTLELVGPVQYVRSNFVNGIESLPVRCTPEGT